MTIFKTPAGTSVLLTDGHGLVGIYCGTCGRTSWNPNDVHEKYCGACHRFHADPVRTTEGAEPPERGNAP